MSSEIKIYVADLAASPEEDAEEYAMHDYEGFDGYALSEYEGMESAHEIACFIDAYSDIGGNLLSDVGDLDKARRMAEENYCGCYSSPWKRPARHDKKTGQQSSRLRHSNKAPSINIRISLDPSRQNRRWFIKIKASPYTT